jgi:predicted MFS family arabinose efflux permease
MKTSTTDNWRGRAALMVAHCAGMVDLVALPVWVGTLMAHYRFDPQQAGALATLFLAGAVAASLFIAPRFHRLRGRPLATGAFALAALAFFGAANTTEFGPLALLHVLGGVAAGTGLSVTHGTIGRSANPHKLFGIVGAALGVFAVVFLGATPQLVAAAGGPALFQVFGAVMLVAALVAAAAFPSAQGRAADHAPAQGLPREVWFGILGVSCMALVQAMVFSFFERMGADRGFGAGPVNGVLIAVGLVNLIPAGLAAALQRRLDARKVVLLGASLQALLAITITWSAGFAPYAVAGSVFVGVMIFCHTFAFGLLARLEPTGRAVAATPAMLMVGSAIGPLLGGTLVKLVGYGALGAAAIVIDVVAVVLFLRLLPRPAELPAPQHGAAP